MISWKSQPFSRDQNLTTFYWLLLVTFLPFPGCLGFAQGEGSWTRLAGVIANPGNPGFIIQARPKTLSVSENVIIPHDLFSVCSFTVEDGADAMDLNLINGMAETGGPCGFVKDGPGTMAVAGRVTLSGFITIYDGTLDLSKATLAAAIRVNILGKAKLIPPTSGTPVSEIFVNGDKLAPGLWGPTGSGIVHRATRESPALGGLAKVPDTGPSKREIWKGLKYGIFSHYVWNGYGMTGGVNEDGTYPQSIDEMATALDMENYVNQLEAAQVQYVVFTAWHSGTCPMFPSVAMKKWLPERASCPKHDLLGELLDACRAKGIRTFFYCHPYQPVAEPHNDWINDLFAELVDRYGSRLDGLWLDENTQDGTQDKVVDYRRLMKTLKERNPDLVITQNNGGSQTYGADEGVQEVQWELHEGRMASTYQIFDQTAKSPADMLVTTVIQAAANTFGGGVQWSIDARGAGKNSRGGLDQRSRPILDDFVKLFIPIAESVKNTRPSSSFLPPFSGAVVKLSNLDWGVATQSADGKREYLHVLKAPASRTLTLPPPADGKVFTKARLLDGGQAFTLNQTHRCITLTLPEGMTWKTPDTVIVMEVIAPGGVGMVNNTSVSIHYEGASWQYQRPGTNHEFRGDSHGATKDGDSFSFTFDGTDVQWISSRGPNHGLVEVAIDGVSQGIVDLSEGSGTFQIAYSKSGLPRGRHRLTGTKRSGALMTVDAFKVSDLVNNHELDFPDTTRLGARAAELTGPWEPQGGSWINGHGFTLRFHGTAVEVFGGPAFGSGDLVLAIDAQPHSTVHCHGGQSSRSLAKITGLPYQLHTLTGQYSNPHPAGFIPALDGFAVTRPDFWSYRKGRGLGEINDDAQVSELRGSVGTYTFDGSGVEVITTRDIESRTAYYTLEGGGSSLWAGLNHYSPVQVPGSPVFRRPNLMPGRYTVSFQNEANPAGLSFSWVNLNIDAVRVFKGESSSASPLFWGADGRGESGIWDAVKPSWHDGAAPLPWQDMGANDQIAIFSGNGGLIEITTEVRVNRLVFRKGTYQFRGQPITLTGANPKIHIADSITVHLSLPVRLPNGTMLATGTYTTDSHPDLISGRGRLLIEHPR